MRMRIYSRAMQLLHIRKSILKISQQAMADIAGTTQASVSRWETGEQEPSLSEMGRIRDAALARGLEWNDRWFFDAPSSPAESLAERPAA
jgi:transcriptional regulator with XRE-family HTH domain